MDTNETMLVVYMIFFMIMCILFAVRTIKQSKQIQELRDQLIKKEDEKINMMRNYCPCCGRRLEDK